MRQILFLVVVVSFIATSAAAPPKESTIRHCGRRLVEMVTSICGGCMKRPAQNMHHTGDLMNDCCLHRCTIEHIASMCCSEGEMEERVEQELLKRFAEDEEVSEEFANEDKVELPRKHKIGKTHEHRPASEDEDKRHMLESNRLVLRRP